MYFISTLEDLQGEQALGVRTVGFVSDLDKAIRGVENNVADLNETIYDYAIIEELPEGLYPMMGARILFKFNYETKKYERISLNFPYREWQAVAIG